MAATMVRATRILHPPAATLRRLFSTSRPRAADAGVVSPAAPAPIVVKKPVGGFRGGLVGFLLGLSAAGGYGYLYLFEEYQSASNLLLVSVEELKASTQKMTNHIRRIEAVERELKTLHEKAATQNDVASARAEVKKLVDGLRIEHLDLKAHVWGVEQELKAVSEGNSVRLA